MAGQIADYLQIGSGAPSGAPSIPGVEWGFYQDSATGDSYYWNLFSVDWSIVVGASVVYPKRATLWHDQALVTVGNALLVQVDSAARYAMDSLQNTSANGDTFTQSFLLQAGTYTLAVLGFISNAQAKLDWYIDNVLAVSGQDWYNGSTVKNTVKTASVTVATDGLHVLKGVVNGRNASNSTGYNIQLTKYWLYPSAD